MTPTETKTESAFGKACDKADLPESQGKYPPFFYGYKAEGRYFLGTVTLASERTMKKPAMVNGKPSKTKKTEVTVWTMMLNDHNLGTDFEVGKEYSIEPSGLLAWKFGKKKDEAATKKEDSFSIGALCTGKDDEGRWQYDLR